MTDNKVSRRNFFKMKFNSENKNPADTLPKSDEPIDTLGKVIYYDQLTPVDTSKLFPEETLPFKK